MSYSIIFHKDTLHILSNLQKKLLFAVNNTSPSFMPYYPLWVNITNEINPDSLEEFKKLNLKITINKAILDNLDKKIICPVEIEENSQKFSAKLTLGTLIPGRNYTKEKLEISSEEMEKQFPIVCKIFQIAETIKISENSYGVKKAIWIKSKK